MNDEPKWKIERKNTKYLRLLIDPVKKTKHSFTTRTKNAKKKLFCKIFIDRFYRESFCESREIYNKKTFSGDRMNCNLETTEFPTLSDNFDYHPNPKYQS